MELVYKIAPMRYRLSCCFLMFVVHVVVEQAPPKAYQQLILQADSLYKIGAFRATALVYTRAFQLWDQKANHHYNAATCWTKVGELDSAFTHLERMAALEYTDYRFLKNDVDFKPLKTDVRWERMLQVVQQNEQRIEKSYNRTLIAMLDTVFFEDQRYRRQVDSIRNVCGEVSPEMKQLRRNMRTADSLNLIKVSTMLDHYGWLGSDVIGKAGSKTLFLVIQHADQQTQERYIAIFRNAVIAENAKASDLALLEDRLALSKGRRQIYGSQIGIDRDTRVAYVLPLENPEEVDQRRAEVGLPPIAEYVVKWNIIWDVEQYKKDILIWEEKENKAKSEFRNR